MDLEYFRQYCLAKPLVTEGTPFGDDVLVFKVAGKMFALTDIDLFQSVNLKCDPERATELREQFPKTVLPGYHMNKKHWNTVLVNHGLEDNFMISLVDDSYDLVVAGLPKRDREKIKKVLKK